MIVVGIDPDSKAHGVAIYIDGELGELNELSLSGIINLIDHYNGLCIEPTFSIEDVLANDFVYARNMTKNNKVNMSIARSVGRCQQAQHELMVILDYMGVNYVKHKPQKGNWAKNKAQFQQVTGWTGRSNEDTRAAAYFGWLAL